MKIRIENICKEFDISVLFQIFSCQRDFKMERSKRINYPSIDSSIGQVKKRFAHTGGGGCWKKDKATQSWSWPRYRGGIAGRLRGGPAILTEFRENTLLGGHRRQECLSCHREAVGIPGILPRVEGRCASKSTIVLNSCFLMDSWNRHSSPLQSFKTLVVGRNEHQFIPFAIRSRSSSGSEAGKQCLSLVLFIDAF